MLARQRYATFHAGAVSFEKRGILLPGARRCGKSVLTLGLLLKGGRYLSEDVAVVDHRSLRLTSCGEGVSLRRDAIALFPEMDGRWTPIPSANREDPLDQVAFSSPVGVGSGISEPCPITLIVYPIYDTHAASARLEPLSAGQAALHLLENCISLGAQVHRGLDIVVELIKRADVHVLRYHDARDACDLIVDAACSTCSTSMAPARQLSIDSLLRKTLRWRPL
jgi:hypothetical protein